MYICNHAEIPSAPRNVEVSLPHSSQDPDHPLSLQWEAPDNINKFDLDHYMIHISPSSQDSLGYTMNVTSSSLEYPFGLVLTDTLGESVNIHVSAISKCSQQGEAMVLTELTGRRSDSVETTTTGGHQLTNVDPQVSGML